MLYTNADEIVLSKQKLRNEEKKSWLASRIGIKKNRRSRERTFFPLLVCVCAVLLGRVVVFVKLCPRAILSFSELLWFYYRSQVINATRFSCALTVCTLYRAYAVFFRLFSLYLCSVHSTLSCSVSLSSTR